MFGKKESNEIDQSPDDANAVTRDIAEADFGRMLKAARVKWDRYCKAEGRDGEDDKETVIGAIMDGCMTVNDDGFPTVLTDNDATELREIKIRRRGLRGDWLAMDRVKEGNDVAKQDAVVAKFLGLAPALLTRLEESDYDLLYSLWTMFRSKRW